VPRLSSAFRVIAAAMSMALAPAAPGQSMTVFSGDRAAQDCYMAATLAVQMRSATRDDLVPCTEALQTEKLSPRDVAATYVNRGIVHAALQDYGGALADYARASKVDGQAAEAYVNRGNVYFLAARYAHAAEQYTRAVALGLRRAHVAYFNRGLAYEYLGELERAAADYRRALELVPDWVQPRHKLERVLGKIQHRQGLTTAAR